MIRTGIVGAAGYSGLELLKLLLDHPRVEITRLFGYNSAGNRIDAVHPSLKGLIADEIQTYDEKLLEDLDLLFIALPSGQASPYVKGAYAKGVKVIDLGGDFRLTDLNDYSKYYKHGHTAPELVNIAVYGLSEWNEKEIKKASIVANPGCYPTSVLLPLIPLLKENIIIEDFISIVSYSGTSGAGKTVSENMIFSEINENIRAYKVGNHQHIPEIKKYIALFSGSDPAFSFVPHLLPITRGIYTTIQMKTNINVDEKLCIDVFKKYYSDSPFIRVVHPAMPEIKNVTGTNYCDIGFSVNNGIITVLSTIDNLIKGAAGQAVQNMNIMFGIDHTEGILKCSKKKYLKAQSA